MAEPKRVQRVAEQMRKDLADIIRHELRDPRISSMVSLTRVELSADMRYAKAFVSIYGDTQAKEATMTALHKATGLIRREVGQRLGLRYAPQINFKMDPSIEEGARILELINRTQEDNP